MMTDADRVKVFTCDNDAARVDVYLAGRLDCSRSRVQQAIKDGRVCINKAIIRQASRSVKAGDKLSVQLIAARPIRLKPEPLPLDIVYEDDSLIVINKAAGMAVHPGAGRSSGTLVNALLHHVGVVPEALNRQVEGLSEGPEGPMGAVRPGIVHRLDMDTSGLMVVAKDDLVHRRLQAQFEARTIDRLYAGIVWGIPEPPSGEINAPIGRDPQIRTRMAVRSDGRHAFTRYDTRISFAHASLVSFRLQTGRTHQIRVHARHLGHAILGDRVYGGDSILCGPVTARRKAFYRNVLEHLPRQALHAQRLGFVHPRTGSRMCWESIWPSDMEWVIERLPRDPV